MALDALIFDIDGTLLNTNPAHVEAWRRALERLGYRVAPDRIWIEVGKGGDRLVPAILGESADRRDGDALRHAHTEEFEAIARREELRPFPGALDLLAEVRRRGLKVALATSSKRAHLKVTSQSAGVDLTERADLLVSADQTGESKPAPDLVRTAVERLGLSPAQCAMVGDTPYDAEACRGAGVVCLGVESGGNDAATLRRAGTRAVWADPRALLQDLDRALRVASPGSIHLTWERMGTLMAQAIAAAEEAFESGDAPIGSVLADGSGQVIARGWNQMWSTGQKTAHAEMMAFRNAGGREPLDARDLILVSTLEPCVMCTGAAMEAAVDTVVYGLAAPPDAGTCRMRPPRSPESQMPRIVGGVLARQSRELLRRWLERFGDREQARYVRQLLAESEEPETAGRGQ